MTADRLSARPRLWIVLRDGERPRRFKWADAAAAAMDRDSILIAPALAPNAYAVLDEDGWLRTRVDADGDGTDAAGRLADTLSTALTRYMPGDTCDTCNVAAEDCGHRGPEAHRGAPGWMGGRR